MKSFATADKEEIRDEYYSAFEAIVAKLGSNQFICGD